MAPSLRALLAGVIDYAGLFPPAKLSLDEAIRNYARYRTEPEAWMLGRFIMPAARLAELSPYVEELFGEGPPLTVSALGRGGPDSRAFLSALDQDLNDIATFGARHVGRAAVESYEAKFPADVLEWESELPIAEWLGEASRRLAALPAFYEPTRGRFAVMAAVAGLTRFNHWGRDSGTPPAGFKLRCGGTEPDAIPTTDQIATVITACRAARLALKFTAGLHHPVRRLDSGLQKYTHGFFNVFIAPILPHPDETSLRAVLKETNPDNFAFSDERLRWGDLTADVVQIEDARRDVVTSFGSCSFDEPRDDLRSLGLL
jgi:hypothetical protein